MHNLPALGDLRLFCVVLQRGSLAAAAAEIGASPSFVSKRLSLLESALGTKLLQGLGDAFMFATGEDMPAVQELCKGYGLAPTEFDESTETLILREPEGDVVGCCSLKVAGSQGLLFNLAVAPSRRGEGLGWILADGTIRRARNLGRRVISLATTDAAAFFDQDLD